MEKFKNKYRIPSARMQNWDYRWCGYYFITICSHRRVHCFGEIEQYEMHLSHLGIIAELLWHQIPFHAPNISLGTFTVMPNHIHGILIITNDNCGDSDADAVETGHALSLPKPSPFIPKTIGQSRFQNIGKGSVSSIIGSYKAAVTKNALRFGLDMKWQTRFHDHIIRNEQSLERITHYIINNHANWADDKFYND